MTNIYESLKAMAGYFNLAEIKPVEIVPGVNLQLVSGEKIMLSFVTLQPGSFVPLHQHPHEQMGYLLEGELVFYLNAEDEAHARVMKPGDIYIAPGGTPHAARVVADKPCLILDIFGPPREDYLAKFKEIYGHAATGQQQATEE